MDVKGKIKIEKEEFREKMRVEEKMRIKGRRKKKVALPRASSEETVFEKEIFPDFGYQASIGGGILAKHG